MEIDWTSTGGDFPLLPSGTKLVKITEWEKVSASTGTQQIRWHANVERPEDEAGSSLVEHTPLTEKSLWKLANLVAACGIDTKALGKMTVGTPAFVKVLNACKGRRVYWNVYQDSYDGGDLKNKVKDYKKDDEQEELDVGNIPDNEDACPF